MKRLALIILSIAVVSAGFPADSSVAAPADPQAVTLRVFTEDNAAPGILDKAVSVGGRSLVFLPEVNYLAVEVSSDVLDDVLQAPGIISHSYSGSATSGDAQITGRSVDRYDPLIQHNNLSAVKIPELRSATGTTGQGITIAVIDTGIDVGHSDLQRTPHGHRKVMDWKDFTGEGLVDTRRVALAQDGVISTAYGQVNLGSVLSKSGRYRYGLFREDQLDAFGTIGQDVNGNGSTRDSFIVVLVDTTRAGVYDMVYVDTNGNRDLSDEAGLYLYSRSGNYTHFGSNENPKHLTFVAAEIDPGGSFVSLGFDGNGHGTHVAGLASAGGPKMTGAAPGARLMSLKALSSSGDGSWENIAKAMTYAAQNGAHVISISAGGVASNASLDSPESLLMAELGRRYGVVFSVASGNDGPGLGRSSTPGHPDYAVTVGAYLSASMWRSIYGHVVSGEGTWLFSAPGPRPDGSLAPDILAPGSAVSAVPTFHSASGYAIMSGTSMAVPYAAGTLALLAEAARRLPWSDSRAYKKAMSLGARKLPDVPLVEQGFGILDARAAWGHLRELEPLPLIRSLVFDNGGYREGGVFYTAPEPSLVNLYLGSFTPWTVRLDFSSTEPWMTPARPSVTIPPVHERVVGLNYDVPKIPGLYSGFLLGNNPLTHGHDVAILNTIVVPHVLAPGNNWAVSVSDILPAARHQRYFFQVPEGADSASFSLQVLMGARTEALGRARFYVFGPDGREVAFTGYVGRGQAGQGETVSRTVAFPEPGVYEVVVESDPALSQYGRGDTYYQFRARASGMFFHGDPVEYWASPGDGGTLDLRVPLTNNTGAPVRGRVVGLGLSRVDPFVRSEVLKITDREAVMRQIPDVREGTELLRVWAKNPNPAADLDLFVYRYDSQKQQWVEVASSAERGVSTEVVEIRNPQAGQYVAYVEAYGLGGATASFEYGHFALANEGSLVVEDSMGTRGAGDTWSPIVRVQLPSQAGTYYGNLLVSTDEGYMGRLPITVHVGKPEASIEVRPQLLQPGVTNQVTIKVTDPRTGRVTGAAVEVNGRLYHLAAGQVVIPVTPAGNEVELTIRVVDTGWGSIPQMFRLGVGHDPGALAFPVEEQLHKKILHQLGAVSAE